MDTPVLAGGGGGGGGDVAAGGAGGITRLQGGECQGSRVPSLVPQEWVRRASGDRDRRNNTRESRACSAGRGAAELAAHWGRRAAILLAPSPPPHNTSPYPLHSLTPPGRPLSAVRKEITFRSRTGVVRGGRGWGGGEVARGEGREMDGPGYWGLGDWGGGGDEVLRGAGVCSRVQVAKIRGIASRELDGFIDPVSQGRQGSCGPAVVSAA
ncbi:hypothetical protein O3P69_020267 [Scylla paramamosain]|uniref:Uncharacterized protein n=1 Tax=Scylla paramamosain TaxID=85552 RepID=A0AAW0TLK6_SCYPA